MECAYCLNVFLTSVIGSVNIVSNLIRIDIIKTHMFEKDWTACEKMCQQ